MSFMNQNIIDKINSFGQTLCIQPVNNEMISLSQLKAKNFLVTTASKHYKVPEIEEPKPRKKYQNLAKIQFKFQIEDEDYHSVLKEIVQMQKNRFPLMPLHLHYKPNPSMQGLSIGRITNEQEMQRPMTLEECRNTIKTQKMSRDTHRDTSQPILEEFNKQLSCTKIKEIQPAKVFTDRSKSSKLHMGSTFQPFQNQTQQFEVVFDNTQQTCQYKRRITQKQFNLYKNRKIATPNLAMQFKQIKEKEQDVEKRIIQERRKEFDREYFEKLP
ncbi:unnamed protein product (macronuclear) [Paramecium tetraurelia]|uniref:TPX2 central domain-containing protein n=1 Tax=Paramecium tetraurelia TaxID=5888 RepID=A0E4B4_PARTE|nr:uncharacterized protein GSPATT00023305001 [Paramecium tetraurelia]CAK90131.1 unnamed protein product [Paramecium tetraurelia]|eukprot:XP_001457528.1 hypothetical protein (macronuclear) [Paramecium tetraurelia strain d4-2]